MLNASISCYLIRNFKLRSHLTPSAQQSEVLHHILTVRRGGILGCSAMFPEFKHPERVASTNQGLGFGIHDAFSGWRM